MNKSNKYIWFSFLPAIAYWYLEANYDLKTALVGGLILAVLEMLVEKIFTKHIHTISKVNFFLILILGGIAFVAADGIWFKLQPAFTGVLMGSYILYRVVKDDSLMLQMMKEMNQTNIPDGLIQFMEKNMAIFLLAYGLFMGVIAITTSTDTWLFFKTGGFYIATFIFFIIQMLYIRRKARS